MDMNTVKSEVSPGRRPLCILEGENEAIMCVKRRRRDPSVIALSGGDQQGDEKKQPDQQVDQPSVVAATSTVKRSSKFRGVSRHRWTGRFEAHLWDKGSWNPTQRKKGKQVYLGAYDEEESAARAYDLAAIKYWGSTTFTNFPASDYEQEIELMQNVTREEYLASLRRRSSGFSRGVSKYRGVARHHHNGRWEARIGRVFGNKYLYLGTYSTQEEAAHAYDIAAIEYRGINAVTNFDLSTYIRWLRPGTTQELKPSIESSSPKQNSEEPDLPFLSTPCKETDLGTPHQKQDIIRGKLAISPHNKKSSSSSSSSPSALGLLLRSSIFKELVEKNSNNALLEDDTEGNETKKQSQRGDKNGFGRLIYEGAGGDIPFAFSSTGDALPALALPESSPPLFNRTGQSFWNGSLNLPTSLP